jgi:hypothetical protein
MRAFATAWPEEQIVQQLLAQITWAAMSRCLGLERLDVRESYARATQQHGWSRDDLIHQIESVLHGRVGREQEGALACPLLGGKDVPEERGKE